MGAQVSPFDGWSQGNSDEFGVKWLGSGYILKVESTRLALRTDLPVECRVHLGWEQREPMASSS